ncbi:MAG: AI-2E family transporter [Actinomycetota bacterium]|nr:AI-2E family transporter [Actinomycetota bacterium]
MSVAPSRWPPMSYWAKVTATILIVIGLARILLAIGPILVLVLVAVILAFGFQPALAWLEHRGLSRGTSVALGLLGGFLLVGLFLWLVLPDVIAQLSALVRESDTYLARAKQEFPLLARLDEEYDIESRLGDLAGELPSQALGLIGSFTALVFNSLTVLILTIYFTINLPRMRHGVARLLGREDRLEFQGIYDEAVRRVGGYVLGNLVVSAIAGTLSFIFFLIIGLPFGAALAFLVAVLDLVPTVGALIAAAIAGLVAAFSGVPELIATIAFFLVYQQIENYVIQPRVMGKTVEMSAPVVILAVLIGGSLLGVIGALLAIPTAAIMKVAFRELFLEDRIDRVREEDRRATQPVRVEPEETP